MSGKPPSLTTVKALTDDGATLRAYDPEALDTFREAFVHEVGKALRCNIATVRRVHLEAADALGDHDGMEGVLAAGL